MNPESIPSALPGGPLADETPPAPAPAADGALRRGPTNAQYFLGLFVLWQLFFLLAHNFTNVAKDVQDNDDYLPESWQHWLNRESPQWLRNWYRKEGHVNDACEVARGLAKRLAELTNEPQGWSLFAPDIGKEITFVAVELRWDDDEAGADRGPVMPYEPELLLSDNEPADPNRFFRWGQFRLRKYESNLDVVLRVKKDEPLAEAVDRWRDRIREKVAKEWDTTLAYLKWRCREYMARHPRRPWPSQVILLVRRYHVPAPEERRGFVWDAPHTVPLARWRPGVQLGADYYPVERYNPVALSPEVLALLNTWAQSGSPFHLVPARCFPGDLVIGHFEKLAR